MTKQIVPDEVKGWDLAREVAREVVQGAAAQPRRQAASWAAATMVIVVVLAALHAAQAAYVAVIAADVIALLSGSQGQTAPSKPPTKRQKR